VATKRSLLAKRLPKTLFNSAVVEFVLEEKSIPEFEK
jgi:hypothetical protein